MKAADEENDRIGIGVRPCVVPGSPGGGDGDVETVPLGHTSHRDEDGDGEEMQTFAYIHFREDYHRTFSPTLLTQSTTIRNRRLTG